MEVNLNKRDKEHIRFNTEALKLLVLLFIATGGGTVTLFIYRPTTATHMVLSAFGILATIIFGIMTIFVYRETLKMLKNG